MKYTLFTQTLSKVSKVSSFLLERPLNQRKSLKNFSKNYLKPRPKQKYSSSVIAMNEVNNLKMQSKINYKDCVWVIT